MVCTTLQNHKKLGWSSIAVQDNGQASFNQELMSGPDLTNQIVGILLRFREGRVAFMADIEAIFYQV